MPVGYTECCGEYKCIGAFRCVFARDYFVGVIDFYHFVLSDVVGNPHKQVSENKVIVDIVGSEIHSTHYNAFPVVECEWKLILFLKILTVVLS